MAHNLIFMTGATGVLGQELVKELLRTTNAQIALLARAKNRASHSERVKKILTSIGIDSHLGSRVHVIEGDVTHHKFGIKKTDLIAIHLNLMGFLSMTQNTRFLVLGNGMLEIS